MFIVHSRFLRLALVTLAAVASVALLNAGPAGAVETIVLRSGNALPGNPDPYINVLVGSGGTALSPNPFMPSHFAEACAGPSAVVISQPISPWVQHLECDLEAKWIGIDALATPASALYCQPFEIETACIERATLQICWAADDNIGDQLFGGGNPEGVFVNGVAVTPMITGGSYAAQTQSLVTDIASLVSTGMNYLQIYNRDAAFVVSGVIYSATIEIYECAVPAETSTWGAVKSLFDTRERQ